MRTFTNGLYVLVAVALLVGALPRPPAANAYEYQYELCPHTAPTTDPSGFDEATFNYYCQYGDYVYEVYFVWRGISDGEQAQFVTWNPVYVGPPPAPTGPPPAIGGGVVGGGPGSTPVPPPVNRKPYGALYSIDQHTIVGYAKDDDQPGVPLWVNVYADALDGRGMQLYRTHYAADVPPGTSEAVHFVVPHDLPGGSLVQVRAVGVSVTGVPDPDHDGHELNGSPKNVPQRIPEGAVQGCDATTCWGYAWDRDVDSYGKHEPIGVRIFADWGAGVQYRGVVLADQPRPDLAGAGIGDRAFSFAHGLPGGSVVTAVGVGKREDSAEDGADGWLQGSATTPPSAPIGVLDGVDANLVAGWAQDKDRPDLPLTVHVHIGSAIYPVVADQPRPDLEAAGIGAHSFSMPIPTGSGAGQPVRLFAVGVDSQGSPDGVNAELSNSGGFVTQGQAGAAAAPASTALSAGAAESESAAPAAAGAWRLPRVYEAEDTSARSASVRIAHDRGGHSGRGFLDFANDRPSGEHAQWTVQVARAGRYELSWRYANGGGADRPLTLAVNGGVARAKLSMPPIDGWDAWRTSTVTADLKAGSNTIRVATAGNSGANLDVLSVSPVVARNPGLPGLYQMEDARRTGGAAVARKHQGYTGGGYIDFANPDDTVTQTVRAQRAGRHTILLRYANASPYPRPLLMTVNSGQRLVLHAPPTGAWTRWLDLSVPVNLRAGGNTIRLRAGLLGAPNIDRIEVAR